MQTIEKQFKGALDAFKRDLIRVARRGGMLPEDAATCTAPVRALAQMLQAARDYSRPMHYTADLTRHDRDRLLGPAAPQSFVWMLRACGTQLIDAAEADGARWLDDYARAFASQDAPPLYFTWDGARLRECAIYEARAFLEQQRAGGLRRAA